VLNLGHITLISIIEEVGWTSELAWMLWRREKLLAPARN
jgi:hypothetical protein